MSGATVLERELLGANSARPRHHHRHEDANLILQLGTVVTATLQDIDSPPSSECTITPPSRSQILARSHHENKRLEERNNERHEKCRSNNHILPYQFVLQDHNYGAPPPPTPPLSPAPPPPCSANVVRVQQAPPLTAQDLCGMAALATVADQVRTGSTTLTSLLLQAAEEDSRGSPLSSDEHDDPGLEGEETETAAEGEGDEDSVTRCICDLEHDDGYMICCDKCCVWQHVDCMGIDRTNIPDEYLCELCQPRRVDRTRARNLQMRKQMHNDTSSSDDDMLSIPRQQVPLPQQQRRLSNSTARKRPAKRETKKVVKRQRRDSAAVAAREQRVSERRANKKKESMIAVAANTPVKSETKRIGTRRRSKGKAESVDEETQDSWGNTTNGEVEPQRRPPQPLRQWIDSYEEAVTNHYSPELRARISSIKVNGVHSDFKVASSSVQRCRTSLQENGVKILISTQGLHANQPIIEVRGKYMLANQQSLRRGGGGGALSPSSSPYLLFYTLPKENTEVCVDARTYGNDARFVRRACKPNAEVRHCIEKGTLHLYLVASGVVDKHSEITIKHEEGGTRFPCKDCPPHTPTPAPTRNGFVTQESVERGSERRRRGSRRSTISEESSTPSVLEAIPSPPVLSAPVTPSTVTTPVVTTPTPVVPVVIAPSSPPPIAPESPPAPTPAVVSTPVTRRAPKSPIKTPPVRPTTPTPTSVQQGEDSNDATSPQEDKESASDKKKMTREERKMEAIMKAFERLEKAEQRKQQQQHSKRGDREDSTSSRHSSRDDDDDHEITTRRKGRRTRGRSSSGASNQATSADESCGAPMLSPATPVCASPRALASPPPPPIPSPEKNPTVLLNSLGFKFPKTKKGLMNEWLNKPSEAPASPVKLENNEDGIVSRTGSAAAKKRWLRQAISEECEPPLPATPTCSSPNSRGGSPPCGDYVTPLKKRRLARASVSSEQSFTPPTTPASDKEGAHSPDLEEAPVVDSAESRPPASQIINAARCVEEAVMVLSAGSDFLDNVMGEKKEGESKSIDEVPTKEIKVEPKEAIAPTLPVVTEVKPDLKLEVKEEKVEPTTPVEVAEPVTEIKKCEPVQEIKEKKEEVVVPIATPLAPPPPPPQESSTPPVRPKTPPSVTSAPTAPVEKPVDVTPASIKRKLSISEYRQRKQQKEEEKGEGSDDTTSLTSQDEERPSSASPSDTLLELSDVKTEGSVAVGGSYMRWSSEPTLVERQRENLTERLKREFGLFVDDQDPNKANKKVTGIPGITGVVTPTTVIPSTLVNNTTVANNDKLLLPELPPLVPPAIRSDSPHNIPLPPCAPIPIHDLLAEPPPPPPPPIEEKPPPLPPTSINNTTLSSKSIPVVPVQNGPLMKIHGKSLISGGVQIKNQTPTTINNTTVSAGIVSNVKIPIPTSSTMSVSKSINNSSS